MRISTAEMFRQGLAAIQEHQTGVARTQQQVATGKRILTPADDPAGAKKVLDLHQSIALTRQYQANGDAATSRLALEDTILGSITNLLQRVRELAVQGNNGTYTDGDREAIALEITERLEELLGLANSKDGNGEFLFAGFSVQSRPFVRDGGGGFLYHGDQGQRLLQIGPTLQTPVGDSGTDVFQAIVNGNGTFVVQDDPLNTGSGVIDTGTVTDPAAWDPGESYTITFVTASTFEVRRDSDAALVTSGAHTSGAPISFKGIQTGISGTPAMGDSFTVSPSTNQDMFTTVQNLVDALRVSGDDPASGAQRVNALNRVLVDLDHALDNTAQIRAKVGARLTAIESERDTNETVELHLQERLLDIENLDLAAAITQLNQQLSSLEAAQQSFVRLQGMSLFNFL